MLCSQLEAVICVVVFDMHKKNSNTAQYNITMQNIRDRTTIISSFPYFVVFTQEKQYETADSQEPNEYALDSHTVKGYQNESQVYTLESLMQQLILLNGFEYGLEILVNFALFIAIWKCIDSLNRFDFIHHQVSPLVLHSAAV